MQLRRIRPFGEMALLAGIYLGVAWVSLGLDFAVNNVTAVWPPTGIALAALLLRGPALWPGILVGSFLANWLTHVPVLASVGVGAGDALECLAAFWLLRRVGFGNSLDQSRDVGALLLAAIVCAPLSATVGTASMLAGGAIAAADAPSRWLTWCFGDTAGVILVAPVALTWFCRPRPLRGTAGPAERAALVATLAIVVLLVFGKAYPFPYPVFPILVWAGLRGGTRGAASTSLVISAASVFFQGRALPGMATMGGSIYHLLAFDALAGATALMLAAAVVEREAARGEERSSLNELKLSRERLQQLSRRVIEAQETERSHIARELHDEIGQALTAVKISLQAAESRAGSAAVRSRLEESTLIVDEALDQVRNMSVALRPSLLDDLGLVPALRWYLEQQSVRGGFEAHFEADPEIEATQEVQTACFRIAQEALTNVSRHAGACVVRLEVRQAGGRVRLAVTDDGKGFDVALVFERSGADASLGLHGMRERARLLGGRVTVQSEPARGTIVRAEFPSARAE